MVADDLVVCISFIALGAVVPGAYSTCRIKHVDGVVLHRVNQEMEPLLKIGV